MGLICDWFISLVKKAMESAFLTKIKKCREKRADLKVFGSSIQKKARELTGNKETGMVRGFLEQDHIYGLLRKTLIIEEKEEVVKQIKVSFKNYARRTFEPKSAADECIDYAVDVFLRLRGSERQRNEHYISNQLTRIESSLSLNEG